MWTVDGLPWLFEGTLKERGVIHVNDSRSGARLREMEKIRASIEKHTQHIYVV